MNRIPAGLAIISFIFLLGCSQTTHPVVDAPHGAHSDPSNRSTSWAGFVAQLEQPGPVSFEKHVAADWVVPRKGLINLRHPEAKAQHLANGPEPIEVYFYVIDHPEHGSFMVDTGVARSMKERRKMPVRFPVNLALPLDDLEVHLDTKTYIEGRDTPLAGVFLTHLHLDHILGLTDVPREVPIFIGPGEADDRRATHALMRPTTNLNLKGFSPLRQWEMVRDPEAPFPYVDVFGDGSVMGLHTPGHTEGTMAFVARTVDGSVLLVGDASHTVWGWKHGVEPGTFNTDMEVAATSLERLRAFAASHPSLAVHLGHQSLADEVGEPEMHATR